MIAVNGARVLRYFIISIKPARNISMRLKTKARIVAACELVLAALLMVGIWLALPARWWVVDIPGSILAAFLALGAVGLIFNKTWGWSFSWAANWLTLAMGLTAVSTLAFTASYLSGVYGPIGGGGALILGAVAALLLPYLVGLPLIQLLLLR
jgi:hypothetical protein